MIIYLCIRSMCSMSFSFYFYILTHVFFLNCFLSLIRVWCRSQRTNDKLLQNSTKLAFPKKIQKHPAHRPNDKIKLDDLTSWHSTENMLDLYVEKWEIITCFCLIFQTLREVELMFFLIKPTSLEDLGHPYTVYKKIKTLRHLLFWICIAINFFWSMFGTWKQNNLGGEPQKATDQPTPREPWLDTI